MLRKDGWQCEQLRLQMDYEISMALFIEAPQVRQNGGLYRFCPYPRVLLPMADIGLSIGPALALCPAGKSMATHSDPVFQSFLSSFSGNFSVKFSKNVTCVRESPVSQRPLASPKYLLLQHLWHLRPAVPVEVIVNMLQPATMVLLATRNGLRLADQK